jgi:hypothetical protein
MIARDHGGNIIFSACLQLQSCRDPLGSELHTIMEGLSLSMNWCNLPILVETNYLETAKMLRSEGVDRSVHAPMVEEIKSLLKVHQTYVTHVNHSENSSSHFLASNARTSRTALWLYSGTDGLASLCYQGCNP